MIGHFLDLLSSQLVRVNGSSMDPTLPHGSWVVVNRRAFSWPRRPERFDIVRLEDPTQKGHWLMKRIVGLPGEEIRLEAGQLFVNGTPTPEPYLDDNSGAEPEQHRHEWWPSINEYVVLGDNRTASTDSRKFGPVPAGSLRGRVGRRLK